MKKGNRWAWLIVGLAGCFYLAATLPAAAPEEHEAAVDLLELPPNSKRPRGIKQDPPLYPYEMSRAGVIGSVAVSFIVDKSGRVRNAYVVESNNPWFERPVLDAVEKWVFSPGEVNGRPVHTRVHQRIEFHLSPGGGRELNLWKVTKGKDHGKLPPELQWETPPVPKMTLFPVYPFELLKAGVAGKASVAYVVGPRGRVVSARLREATAPEFGAAVMAMIDGWEFSPPIRKDGSEGYATLNTSYEFKPGGRADVPVSDKARAILRLIEKKPGAIATLNELDRPLKPRSQRPPVYPSALLEAGLAGEANVEFYIDEAGDVQLPRIVSSTAPEFGYAAVQAIATWRFEKPLKGGKAVPVRTSIALDFTARDPAPPRN